MSMKPVIRAELRHLMDRKPIDLGQCESIEITLSNGHMLDVEVFERDGRAEIEIRSTTGHILIRPCAANCVSIGAER